MYKSIYKISIYMIAFLLRYRIYLFRFPFILINIFLLLNHFHKITFSGLLAPFSRIDLLSCGFIACMHGYTLRLCSIQVLYTGEIDRSVQKNIPKFLTALHDSTYHLEMVHSYGLFRRYCIV